MDIWIAIVVILILISIWYLSKSESFISFMASLSEYGPQPLIILTKYIPNETSRGKILYPEVDNFTKSMTILEIFINQTYKVYSDDGLVREGVVPDYLWDYVKYLNDVAPQYAGKKYCEFVGKDMTYYYMWVNGYLINLGIFAQNCTPIELYPAKKLFELMDYSDLSSYIL